ncbi:hypothetical protein ABW20_dc0103674 [Dactylellina cionopaga]|nr:hypothetical protein ABW20_dc0103674 [Dactylellina cionopaga]
MASEKLLPSPALNPGDALATHLHTLSISTSNPPPAPGALPVLIRKSSNRSLPNSPLRRQSSSPALPGSPSTRPISRSPSMVSLSKLSESSLQAATPPLPPLTHQNAETIAILSDSSYLHKFARSTSKADLDTIVERPERLRAATFGISAAVCKLGAETLSVVKTTRKGSLTDPSVTRVHDPDYLRSLLQACDDSERKIAAKQNELPDGWHIGDLFLCGGSREDLEGCVGAVWEGVDRVFGGNKVKTEPTESKSEAPAFKNINRAFISIRPPGHHCADEEPSGFCYLNNVHIAIARAALQYDMTHAVILDFDLHHGDGSQTIAWAVNDRHTTRAPKNTPFIAYYSLHDINSYPCELSDFEKVRNASTCIEDAHHQNIWNVHLEQYKDSEDFWRLYENKYTVILQKAEAFLAKAKATYKPHPKQPKFKAGIFISAGFDASEHEQETMQRHKVNVLTEFYARFTSDAVELANTYAEGRVLSVLEGGYSDKAIWTGVFSHLCGLAAPQQQKIKKEDVEMVPETRIDRTVMRRSSLAQDLTGKAFKAFTSDSGKATEFCGERGEYNPAWFSNTKLEEVDKAMQVVPSVRKQRDTSNSSYFSPTASSAAKVAPAPKLHRKSSTNLADSAALNRTPSPPLAPPPLPWPAASAAVWRSLLPEHQLAALREAALPPVPPTELAVEKGRRVGKRHSAVGIPAVDIATAASSRPIRNAKKTIQDVPERSGSALSSVAESQVSRRTSMVSVKSSDTADTAITGVSQATSGRRKVSPPQKTVPPKATGPSRAPKTSATGQTATSSTTVKKTATPASSSTVRAPARTSSVRQSVPAKKTGPAIKTNTSPTSRAKTKDQSVSPIEPTTVPSIKTTADPEDSIDGITSSMQSIKLTYKNRDVDRTKEEEDSEMEKQLAEKERLMEQQIAAIQAQKKQLLEKRQRESTGGGPPNGGNAPVEQVEQKSSLLAGPPQAPVETEGEPSGPPKPKVGVQHLPKFTPTSFIPFSDSAKSGPTQTIIGSNGNPHVLNGSSFRDRMAAMTPFKPKEKAPWEIGDEITPARAYKPAGVRTIPPHSLEHPRQPSPRRVDEDLKKST